MKTRVAVVFVVLAAVARCGSTLVVQEVSKDGRFAFVDNATTVEACILTVDDPSGGKDLKRRGYVEEPYKKLPEEVRTLVVWKLLEDTNYAWDVVPACWPTYNSRLRFGTNRQDRLHFNRGDGLHIKPACDATPTRKRASSK